MPAPDLRRASYRPRCEGGPLHGAEWPGPVHLIGSSACRLQTAACSTIVKTAGCVSVVLLFVFVSSRHGCGAEKLSIHQTFTRPAQTPCRRAPCSRPAAWPRPTRQLYAGFRAATRQWRNSGPLRPNGGPAQGARLLPTDLAPWRLGSRRPAGVVGRSREEPGAAWRHGQGPPSGGMRRQPGGPPTC